MKKMFLIAFVAVLVSGLIFAGCAKPAPAPAPSPAPAPAPKPAPAPPPAPPAEAIKLKAVTFLPKQASSCKLGFQTWQGIVNETGKGKVTIDYVGGPEAIPMTDQAEAVRKGAIDMSMVAVSFYAPTLPEALVYPLSHLTPVQERTSGFHDFMVELHKKANFYYLGRHLTDNPFYFYAKAEFKKPQELSGKRFNSHAAYIPFYKAMGLVPVDMPFADIYPALEKGVIEGGMEPSPTIVEWRLYEQFKYIMGPPTLAPSTAVLLINLNTWNRLSKDVQQILIDAQIKLEPQMMASFRKMDEDNLQICYKAGVKRLEWSADDTKWYLDLVERVKWDDVQNKTSPEYVQKVKKLLGY